MRDIQNIITSRSPCGNQYAPRKSVLADLYKGNCHLSSLSPAGVVLRMRQSPSLSGQWQEA